MIRSGAAVAVACAAMLAACDGGRPGTQPAPERSAPVFDPRDQHQLAADIDAAAALDADAEAERLEAIQREWLGKRYRWRVFYLPYTCPAADRCNVLPFDRAGADRSVVHGWMPRVSLDEPTFAALRASCAGAARCAVELEGTMTRLVVSQEYFTAVAFDDVTITADS